MAYLPSGAYVEPAAEEIAVALQALDAAETARIVAARGVDLSRYSRYDAAVTRALIAVHLASAVDLDSAFQTLTLRDLTILRVLWRGGVRVTHATITDAFKAFLTAAEVTDCLTRLQDLALLLPGDETRHTLFVPSTVCAYLLGRTGTPRPAQQVFAGLPSETLLSVCLGLGLTVEAKRKAARLEAVVSAVQDAERIRHLVATLPEQARRVFDEIVKAGGAMDGWRLVQKFPETATGGWGYSSYDFRLRSAHVGRTGNPVFVLLERGLLASYPSEYAGSFTICDEVLTALLPPLQVSPDDFKEPVLSPPPAEARPAGGHHVPLIDLAECLHFVDETAPSLTQKGFFPRPLTRKLARQLSLTDPVYADFLLTLGLHLGLLESSGDHVRVRAKKANLLLNEGEMEARSALLETWKDLLQWRDDTSEGLARTDTTGTIDRALREALLALLRGSNGDGLAIRSLAAALQYRLPARFGGAGSIGRATAGSLDATAFVLGVLRSLSWLGVAEPLTLPPRPGIAPETAGLRLTPAGRALVATAPEADSNVPRTDRIIVQPTLDVLVPPNIEPGVFSALRRFADPAAAGGMRTLTISPTSLRRAFDNGMAAEAVRSFLETHAEHALPSTLEALLREIASRYGRIKVGIAAYYLTVDDPHLLVELQADKRLGPMIVSVLAPTVALVQEQSLPRILERLREAGHMPVAGNGTATPTVAPAITPVPAVLPPDPRILPFTPRGQAAQAFDEGPSLAESEESGEATAKVRGLDAIQQVLQRGKSAGIRVEIEYQSRVKGQERRSVRDIEVIDLFGDLLYAYCHQRAAERQFRLDRIIWARLTGKRCIVAHH